MKKLAILSIAIVLGSSSLFASNDNPIKNQEQKIRNQLAVLLEKPQITVKAEELKAYIEFTLNNKGEIVVLSVDTPNDIVSSYVKNRLNYKKVDSYTSPTRNKVFRITLRIQSSQNI